MATSKEGTTETRHDRLVQFLADYYRDDIATLAQGYPRDERSLVVDWDTLYQHWPEFADDLRNHPHGAETSIDPLGELQEAMHAVELPIDQSLNADGWPEAHIRIRLPDSHRVGVGDLRARDKESYVAVSGQIERVTESDERIKIATFRCRKDARKVEVPQPKDTLQEPGRCPGSCSGKPSFELVDRESTTIDERKLKLTQPPEDAGGGGADLTVYLQDDIAFADGDQSLMDMAGERVTIHGILKRDYRETRGRNARPMFGTYLDAHHIDYEGAATDDIDTDAYRDEIEAHIAAEDTLDRLIESTAPGIQGGQRMRQIKRGVVLYLFRAARKQTETGGALRGDIHLALIGDPATGKTQVLDFIERVTPRSERLSGTESTGVGLTASATQDDFAGGDWVLKPGILPRASGGHAIVDEIDKMSDGVERLHEALETQRIHVSKAGMNATLKTECGVAVAANPVEGRFHDFDTFTEQIDLPPALFGRFDIIHTVQDRPDEDVDEDVAGAVLDRWQANAGDESGTSVPVGLDTYQAWIALAEDCEPRLTDAAKSRLEDWYVSERTQEWGDGVDVIPVTARSVAAAARLAEAHARVHLRDEITVADAEVATDVVKAVMGDVYLDDEGRIDVDHVTEAPSQSQKDRIKNIHGLIADLESETDTGAPKETVIEEADERGISESKAEHEIEKLKQQGEVYEPATNHYRTS